MADSVSVEWIYPPNWDLEEYNPPRGGHKRCIIQLSGISDGTGETDVQKLDISKLKLPNGKQCYRTAIERIQWNIYGYTSILLEWERAPHKTIKVLPGGTSGDMDYTAQGGLIDPSDGIDDGTGDIILTSNGADANDAYDITLHVRPKFKKREDD